MVLGLATALAVVPAKNKQAPFLKLLLKLFFEVNAYG